MQNRGAAPNLFVEELADALALLGMETGVGGRQPHRTIPDHNTQSVWLSELLSVGDLRQLGSKLKLAKLYGDGHPSEQLKKLEPLLARQSV